MSKREKNHHPASIGAIVCLLCGFIALLSLIIFATSNLHFELLLYAYMVFFTLAVLLGIRSLLIKRNARAWIAVVAGLIFIILFLISLYQLSKICVIC